MTKADLVEIVSERVSCPKKEAEAAVDEIFALMRESLCRKEKVKISGFGTFGVNGKRARRGRNPQTGETLTIAERNVLTFTASELLKERILNHRKLD